MQTPFGSGDPFAERMAPAENRVADTRFSHNTYVLRRKILKLIGADFYVDAPDGTQLLYANQKGFKLKEAIRVYTDESRTTEVFAIQARTILDFGATYDITDSQSGQRIGSMRRKGLKSTFLRDEWVVLDASETEAGGILEDSVALALIRRFIEIAALILPQKYSVTLGGREVGEYKHKKNPFSARIEMDFSQDASRAFDRRMAIAGAILLSSIEGKQA